MAASMKCGGGHWNKARLKLFRAITIARAAQLVCVKNNRGRAKKRCTLSILSSDVR